MGPCYTIRDLWAGSHPRFARRWRLNQGVLCVILLPFLDSVLSKRALKNPSKAPLQDRCGMQDWEEGLHLISFLDCATLAER